MLARVTTAIAVTNEIDKILANRGFIPPEEIRSVTLNDVLVDTGAKLSKNLSNAIAIAASVPKLNLAIAEASLAGFLRCFCKKGLIN